MTDNASPETLPQPGTELQQTGTPPEQASTASAPASDTTQSTAEAVECTLDDIDQQLASIKALLGDELSGSPVAEPAPRPEPAAQQDEGADLSAALPAVEEETALQAETVAAELQEPPESDSDDLDILPSLDAEVLVKPAAAPIDASDPAPAAPARRVIPERWRDALLAALCGLARILEIFDKPFKWLGPRPRNILGYVAMATTVVSLMTWLIGPLLLTH